MEWIWVGLAVYLLVGVVVAYRGRLRFLVDTQVALLDFKDQVPAWKKRVFKVVLRLGVIVLYPVFLIWR